MKVIIVDQAIASIKQTLHIKPG